MSIAASTAASDVRDLFPSWVSLVQVVVLAVILLSSSTLGAFARARVTAVDRLERRSTWAQPAAGWSSTRAARRSQAHALGTGAVCGGALSLFVATGPYSLLSPIEMAAAGATSAAVGFFVVYRRRPPVTEIAYLDGAILVPALVGLTIMVAAESWWVSSAVLFTTPLVVDRCVRAVLALPRYRPVQHAPPSDLPVQIATVDADVAGAWVLPGHRTLVETSALVQEMTPHEARALHDWAVPRDARLDYGVIMAMSVLSAAALSVLSDLGRLAHFAVGLAMLTLLAVPMLPRWAADSLGSWGTRAMSPPEQRAVGDALLQLSAQDHLGLALTRSSTPVRPKLASLGVNPLPAEPERPPPGRIAGTAVMVLATYVLGWLALVSTLARVEPVSVDRSWRPLADEAYEIWLREGPVEDFDRLMLAALDIACANNDAEEFQQLWSQNLQTGGHICETRAAEEPADPA